MTKFGEKLGRLDDESVIYRPDDPEQRVQWRRVIVLYIVGAVVAAGLLAAGRAMGLSEEAVPAVLFVGALAFVVGYIIWRRRRNKRLTGSPTTWPS